MQRTTDSTENGTQLPQSVEDGFGRTVEESVPSPAGNLITTRYNAAGEAAHERRENAPQRA